MPLLPLLRAAAICREPVSMVFSGSTGPPIAATKEVWAPWPGGELAELLKRSDRWSARTRLHAS